METVMWIVNSFKRKYHLPLVVGEVMSVCQHLPQKRRSSERPLLKDGRVFGVQVRGLGYSFIHWGMRQRTYFRDMFL